MRKLSMEELGRLSAEEAKTTTKIPLVVVLDNVRSMHNVGSVFRTSDAFLVQQIILCGYTPQPPHRDIHKTALGATETVAWQYFQTTMEAAMELKQKGYKLMAVEQTTNSISLPAFQWAGTVPIAIIFGNEVEGVSADVLALCDAAIEIPQYGMKHSLNISVAAGIVLYRFMELSDKQ
jgi:23S rRNA (guanosine2251-2'-O)-methyltransferase